MPPRLDAEHGLTAALPRAPCCVARASTGGASPYAEVVSTPPEHLSSSAVQTKAEKEIVASLATMLHIGLKQQPGKIALQGGVYIEVDAATDDGGIVVEAYARQGRLKGAQLKKVAQDILNLPLSRRSM